MLKNEEKKSEHVDLDELIQMSRSVNDRMNRWSEPEAKFDENFSEPSLHSIAMESRTLIADLIARVAKFEAAVSQ